jgi:dTDP-4-amino-4,6-dideoxygalactose transaminase
MQRCMTEDKQTERSIMSSIPFNVPPYLGTELDYVRQAVEENRKISGDGPFTKKCNAWFEENDGMQKFLLTTSGTTALEMAAILCKLKPGDEVILPSFTFSSTANAFVLVGAKLVFVDIRPDTMNLDETKVEAAITDKTRVIVPVHYAGVACNMDAIMDIAARHNLLVVEDAAQGVMSTYKGRPLGTIGTFGCFSFHETKNYSAGEGGGLSINDEAYNEDAEIIREKGTNRSRFLRGQVDKYTWVTYGSSYLPSDMNAAYLYAELLEADKINNNRLASWQNYYDAFKPLAEAGKIDLPVVPADCKHNAHMFYLKCQDLEERTAFISYLKEHEIQATFHYVPLHSAPAGIEYGRVSGSMEVTDRENARLVRLPMYYGLTKKDQDYVIETIYEFYRA